jgi:hypothetical protein
LESPLFFPYLYFIKYLKLLWLVSIVSFIVYFLIKWLESGFDPVLFGADVTLLVSGVGFLNKKSLCFIF